MDRKIIFLSFLQLVSEVTRSRERMFYHSWWNASNMEEFWRWWNLPVHKWCVKHVYLPVVSGGYGKMMAMSATFLFSATLHEYLISGNIFLVVMDGKVRFNTKPKKNFFPPLTHLL